MRNAGIGIKQVMTAAAASNQNTDDLIAHGWAALPASYRIPEKAPTLEEARAWCKHLAETHYENFHVATWFLPERAAPAFSCDLRLLPRLR